jgi:hypothetical protein
MQSFNAQLSEKGTYSTGGWVGQLVCVYRNIIFAPAAGPIVVNITGFLEKIIKHRSCVYFKFVR